ncbi:MAG: M20 family metallopeptidase [Saprospiraceae bacterium]
MPSIDSEWYLSKSKEYLSETIRVRRYLHQHPELSFEEHETATFIEKTLQSYGINTERRCTTGVVALIEGQHNLSTNSACLALRADIDALPIVENASTSYSSKNKGVMHACGHDVHTASLVTVARLLNESKSDWSGQVKIIFQPAEEKFPGGASLLIKDGILEDPKPEAILAQHVFPELESGKLGFRSGPFMASADEIFLKIHGKGGHGAMPHTTRDTILIASHVIIALQQIVSRNNNPLTPTVLTLGKINSTGGATNIIPGEVSIEGTFRTFDETWRQEAKGLIKKITTGIVESMGGSVEIDIKDGYPVLVNEAHTTGLMKKWAIDLLGPENIVELPMRTTAEDFSYYSRELPACFYRLGTARPGHAGEKRVHTPDFDIDENAFVTGVSFMTYAAHQWLRR